LYRYAALKNTPILHSSQQGAAMNPNESATDTELDRFYGKTETYADFVQIVNRHKRAVDADDLSDIAQANSIAILAALQDGDLAQIGHIFNISYQQMIAGRVSYEIYGKVGKISVKSVKDIL